MTRQETTRLIAALALIGAVAALGFVLLVPSSNYEYSLIFTNAGLLVKGDQVQAGGQPIGSITGIELTPNNQARVKVSLNSSFVPLHEGTRATIRLTSLSGVANRYIALAPGPQTNRALPNKATISVAQTEAPVDLDLVIDSFDAPTRRQLQRLIGAFASQYSNNSAKQANAGLKYLNPALSSSNQLAERLTADEPALTALLVNSARTVTALAQRRTQLSQLVGNAQQTATALADDNAALQRALHALPTTLRRGSSTFVDLRLALNDLDKLVAVAKPDTKTLAPFLRKLAPLLAEARPTIHDLRLALNRPGANNDLVDATRNQPALERALAPAVKHSISALKQSVPVLQFARPYTPEVIGLLHDLGQASATYDANGHYARVQPIFNAFSFTPNSSGGVLTLLAASQRQEGYQTNILQRCPGSATQPPADGSAPFVPVAGTCNPSLVPPGP